VLSKVREHVNQGVSHLPGRRELTTKPAVAPETSLSIQELVHVESNANRDATDASGQGSFVARFDDEVHVIVLDGVVNDSETRRLAPIGASQSDAHRGENMVAPEWAKRRTERHVNGVAGMVLWAGAMGDGRAPGRRLSAGARATAAPRVREGELLLRCAFASGGRSSTRRCERVDAGACHLEKSYSMELPAVNAVKRGSSRRKQTDFLEVWAGGVGAPFHTARARRRASPLRKCARRPASPLRRAWCEAWNGSVTVTA
jgi:hypothetical protein